MISIYKYSESHHFLRDAWAAKKDMNPSFSMRAWAKKLGFRGNAPLSLMLAGRRPIPKKYVPAFAEDLGLNARESQYLDALVDFGNARDTKERQYYWSRLQTISPEKPAQIHELEHFKFLADPIHTCILEMIDLPTFRNDSAWIKEHLLFPATLARVEDALARLKALGLVQETVEGGLEKSHKHLSSRADVVDEGAQRYHQNVSELAATMVKSQGLEQREFNAYAMNIKRDKLPHAKKLIREFVERFIRDVEAVPGDGDDTYQLNVQFFGLAESGRQSSDH